MKAIVLPCYGSPDVLRHEEVGKPLPADDEVLIRVRAVALNPLDWRLMRGEPVPIRGMTGVRVPNPARLGADLAGEVEAAGSAVSEFKPGDAVFGPIQRRGALAEYVCAPPRELAPMPSGASFEEAATLGVAALTALQGLRDHARVRSGQEVLVNGAAGGVGTFAVQIAKSMGARVTGVCSTRNVELVRSIGADQVVDYSKDDYTAGAPRYDAMLDCIANRSIAENRRVLRPDGVYVVVGGPTGFWLGPILPMIKVSLAKPFSGGQRLVPGMSRQSKDDLLELKRLFEAGSIKPVIDRRYPLREAAEALRYLEQGHARGKVIVSVDGSQDQP